MSHTENLRVQGTVPLITPAQLHRALPIDSELGQRVLAGRETVRAILAGDDPRLMAVVGPCSIHNAEDAVTYARRLSQLAAKLADRVVVIMRVYFEKPRTTVGWKGLINDPHLNDTFDIEAGLRLARSILLDITKLGMPVATEILEPITPQYIADLITLASIGARTTESPTHRQMASGLSMPVGYKNGTDGSLETAVNAMTAARSQHSFLGIDADGRTCIVQTTGNPDGFVILRGGRSGPNYAAELIADATSELSRLGLPSSIVVDCSHANSEKDHRRQSIVWKDVIQQRVAGNREIVGLMLESNLEEGSQKLTGDLSTLKPGVSITDACVGWDETHELLTWAYEQLEPVMVGVS